MYAYIEPRGFIKISMGKASSASYNINYHIVWCAKFRKPILTGKVKTFVEEQLETIAETKGYKILESSLNRGKKLANVSNI